jgi:pyruvate-ferredoxin/flavodoxin oxidoreductase
MSQKEMIMVDGNTADAIVAHAINEVIAIYPITPSSPMGETADEMSTAGQKNIWGTVPDVVELQSEGGASGAVHGSLTAGALTTTFTASQGLLLMLPNMFKIAGELCSTVFHVSARSVAAQALSIFCDHSDVMTTRSTGFALLSSSNLQEISDFVAISQASTLESRVPFVHFFDGFRNSHEIQKIEKVQQDVLKEMIDDDLVHAHRQRGLSPDRPVIRGTSQNPDVFFQGRETVNKYYEAAPAIVQKQMDKYAKLTGRQYHLFDYVGAPDAEKVIIIMGSGSETAHETVEYLASQGDKVGVIKVRLYRPFDVNAFMQALPPTVKSISALDRTKEPGSIGEPLYLDIRSAIMEQAENGSSQLKENPEVLGGRYGLGSKEFTPAMVKAVFDNMLVKNSKKHFTVGIKDDVTHTSLDYEHDFHITHKDRIEAMFYGLGSDGTVGANKNSIKIIGTETDNYTQGYFQYDAKKAGAITISHLRFGPDLIRSPYLCTNADFVACHNFSFLEKYDMLSAAKKGGVFLLNSPYGPEEIWNHMPDEVEQQIIEKELQFYVIDAVSLAKKLNLGGRINTIMQTCFFQISGVLPENTAIPALKKAIKKTYGRKGAEVVNMNFKAVDSAVSELKEVKVPEKTAGKSIMISPVPDDAPEFVKNVTAELLKLKGDEIPVSAMPADGTWMTGTTQYEKRNIAVEIPEWDPDLCIQCGRCALVCPHSAIRTNIYDAKYLENAPSTFKSVDAKGKDYSGMKYTVQVSSEDCTGCGLCIEECPVKERDKETKQETGHKAIDLVEQMPIRKQEAENFKFFNSLPILKADQYQINTVKGSQLAPTLFEFSGACPGCGETPYVKLLTQLYGDRAIIGNATGCSSIYGGNLPTTPYCKRSDGRGPAWSNSLFEDCGEFAYGMRLAVDKLTVFARELLQQGIGEEKDESAKQLMQEINDAPQEKHAEIEEQRVKVDKLKQILSGKKEAWAKELSTVTDYLVKKSVWAVGGDGWAYDIGYGGLDHVLASGRDINALVLDTEVYSNTGGQASKSTPLGAVAKFAAAGKPGMKKDLGMMFMTYGNIYVATVAMGANPNQVVKAFAEAGAYKGPSIIIAYANCIAHGIDMRQGLLAQKNAVESGHFPLYRFNPELKKEGKNPLKLDSKVPSMKYSEAAMKENRYRMLEKTNPKNVKSLMEEGDRLTSEKYNLYQKLADLEPYNPGQ